jgi:hypothetical protein
MATVPQVNSGSGLRKVQADGFLSHRVHNGYLSFVPRVKWQGHNTHPHLERRLRMSKPIPLPAVLSRPLSLKLNSFSATATTCFYIFSRLWWPSSGWVFCNTYPYNSVMKHTNQPSLQQTIYCMVSESISLVHKGGRICFLMFQSNRTRDNVTFTGKLDLIYAISPYGNWFWNTIISRSTCRVVNKIS